MRFYTVEDKTRYWPCVFLKQMLSFANTLSSNCRMFCFGDQIWVWIYLAPDVLGQPPDCPFYLIYFKNRIIWFSSIRVPVLLTVQRKKDSRNGQTGLHTIKLMFWYVANAQFKVDCICNCTVCFFFVIRFVSLCFLCWF